MLKGLPASGKGQPKNSIIPTPQGDKKIGDLKVGDYVFGSNGKPTKVIGVFPRGILPVYKVSFEDGAVLTVDGDHIWTFEGRKSRKRGTEEYVRYNYTTRELYADITLVNPKSRGMMKKHLPIVEPLEYTDETIDIDPYVLGLYLADGSCQHGVPRITKKEPEVVEYMLQLPDAPQNKHQYGDNTPYYTYPKGGNKLWKYLKKTGLGENKSANKFIPEEIFYKSVDIRKKLLYGLMDGDGSIQKKKISKSRVAVYSTASERLKNDVIRLVSSLGGTTLVSLKDKKRRPYWQIRIYTDFNPFLATHEAKEWRKREYRQNTYRTIKNIEKVGFDEVVCIAVEAQDQLYVADTQYYIVTHNTTWAKEQVEQGGNYLIVSKDEIRKMFGGYKAKREKDVLRIRNELIRTGIQLKRNVIVDDTNLNPKHERYLSQLSRELGCKFEINDSFLEVGPEECIKRDIHRGEKAVGSGVIWDMYFRWIAPDPEVKLSKESNKPRAVLCDLDGTLSLNTSGRSFYDMTRVGEDSVDPFMACVVDALYNYGIERDGKPYPSVIMLSGRDESAREKTEKWLQKNAVPYDKLLMRKIGDNRADSIVKSEIYHNEIEPKFAVLGVFDDRPSVVNQWRKLGLRVAQLGNPYIDF